MAGFQNKPFTVPLTEFAQVFPNNRRIAQALFEQTNAVPALIEANEASVAATTALQDATVITLSPNDTLTNEYILSAGQGISVTTGTGIVQLSTDSTVPSVVGGFTVTFNVSADANLILPSSGALATRSGTETLNNKTLAAPLLSGLGNYANDAAAATGGVPIGGVYRSSSQVMVRVA